MNTFIIWKQKPNTKTKRHTSTLSEQSWHCSEFIVVFADDVDVGGELELVFIERHVR